MAAPDIKAEEEEDPDPSMEPEFIYGGPWIHVNPKDCMLPMKMPINVKMSGCFKQSFAYYSLTQRMPVTITKAIDFAAKMHAGGAAGALSELKHDLMTNKRYTLFTWNSPECEKWNNWIKSQPQKTYFGNDFLFTECYVYRKIVEAFDIANMKEDWFAAQKNSSMKLAVEPMVAVAEKMVNEFLAPKGEDKLTMKNEWIALLKAALWANRLDLSHSVGEVLDLNKCTPDPILPLPKPGKPVKPPKKGKEPPPPPTLTDRGYYDPFQIGVDLKFNTLADDSGKSFDMMYKRAEKIRAGIEKTNEKDPEKPEPDWMDLFPATKKKKPKKEKPKPGEVPPEPPPPPPNVPCPSKMKTPQCVFLDIVCDNAGYELFCDICIAHYCLAQNMADKVKFHLKKYPWFVSDATIKDFHNLVDFCKSAQFSKQTEIPPPPPPKVKPGEEPPPPQSATPKSLSAGQLNQLGNIWQQFLTEGKFLLFDEDYWTYPLTYEVMKEVDFPLYQKLMFSGMIIFKGDLNYRKLLGEKNAVSYAKFDQTTLQGFIPAPIVAIRTIKSENICGLVKGRKEQLDGIDKDWMSKGNFGVIQMSKKMDKFPKKPDKPCPDYGKVCFNDPVCPEYTDI